MLVARDAQGHRKVASSAARRGDFTCPDCGQEVVVRAGERVVAHFAHRSGQDCTLARTASRRRRESARRQHERERVLTSGQQELFDDFSAPNLAEGAQAAEEPQLLIPW